MFLLEVPPALAPGCEPLAVAPVLEDPVVPDDFPGFDFLVGCIFVDETIKSNCIS